MSKNRADMPVNSPSTRKSHGEFSANASANASASVGKATNRTTDSPLPPRGQTLNRLSKVSVNRLSKVSVNRLSKVSVNRLSVMISPQRKSDISLNDGLFPNLPYVNISNVRSDNIDSELMTEEDLENALIIQEELKYLPDPIDPSTIDRVIHELDNTDFAQTSNKYFFTKLYESVIQDQLEEKRAKNGTGSEVSIDEEEEEEVVKSVLDVFDNDLAPTFAAQYDSGYSDFEIYDRKLKRELVLKNLTEDAIENRKNCIVALNVTSVDELHKNFYSGSDETNSKDKPNTSTKKFKLFHRNASEESNDHTPMRMLSTKLFNYSGSTLVVNSGGNSNAVSSAASQIKTSNASKRSSMATVDVDSLSVSCGDIKEIADIDVGDGGSLCTFQIDEEPSKLDRSGSSSTGKSKNSNNNSKGESNGISSGSSVSETSPYFGSQKEDLEKNELTSPGTPYGLQRKLSSRALQMIAFGSALGNGLLLNSGKNFTMSGPLGTVLGYSISGLIVLAAMVSYCEVVTVLPIADGVSGLTARFVDDAYGFTLGWSYWAAFAISLPGEIIAAIIMLSFYDNLAIPSASTVAWVLFFVVLTICINLFDVRVFGEVEYGTNIVKILFMVILSFMCIFINTGVGTKAGGYGTKFWDSSKNNSTIEATFGPFRPTYDLNDVGSGSLNGIGGGFGRFLSVLTSAGIASYAYIGTEIVGIAASEAKNPKKSLPSATKKVFWRIIFFYILAVLLVSFNIYSGDPRLLRYLKSSNTNPYESNYVKDESAKLLAKGIQVCLPSSRDTGPFASANKSPWVVAAQSVGFCNFAGAINGVIVFFALSSGSSQLYASSRTLYALAIQSKAPKIFAKCSKHGVPYVAVLFTGSFSLLALVAVSPDAIQIFQYLANISTTFVILCWSGMCLSFVRFYYALKLRPDIISREDPSYPFKSPFQPFLGIFGFVGSLMIVIFVGISVFVKNEFSWAIFMSSYGALLIFLGTMLTYKFVYNTRYKRLDQIDLDTGRKENDKEDWEEAKKYTESYKEWFTNMRRYIF